MHFKRLPGPWLKRIWKRASRRAMVDQHRPVNGDELDRLPFEELLERSLAYLNEQQAVGLRDYELSSYQSWFCDQLTGQLIFSDDGVVKLVIEYEEVGTFSTVTNTWLWAWANSSVVEATKQGVERVRAFGEHRGFEKLIEAKWAAEEVDGWEMTAIAAYILQAKGAYRAPGKNGEVLSFMVFREMNWADGIPQPTPSLGCAE